jgi:hypothetical protein
MNMSYLYWLSGADIPGSRLVPPPCHHTPYVGSFLQSGLRYNGHVHRRQQADILLTQHEPDEVENMHFSFLIMRFSFGRYRRLLSVIASSQRLPPQREPMQMEVDRRPYFRPTRCQA